MNESREVTRIIVAGIGGRMGATIAELAAVDCNCHLVGGVEHKTHEALGTKMTFGKQQDIPCSMLEDILTPEDVVIDFTTPAASLHNMAVCAQKKASIIVGTTGFDASQNVRISDLAKRVAVVKSGNMSLGVNLLMELITRAAASLPDTYDIEIHEAHHRHKLDAPSGTALMLGQAAAKGRNVNLEEKSVYARDAQENARIAGDIGFSVTRAGGIIGEHTVLFGAQEEVLSLHHKALDRTLFARGAIEAAKWLRARPPGLYDMRDVLGL